MLLRRFAATLLLGAVTIALAPAQTTGDPTRDRAHVIFDAMRAAVNHLASPPYVAFTLQDAGYTDDSKMQEQLRVLVRMSDGVAVVVPLTSPNGVQVAAPAPMVFAGPGFGSLSYIVRLGDFTLYDFGMRYGAPKRPGFFDAPGTPEPEATPAEKTLAVVRAYNPGYFVTDLGDTTLDDHAVYHLGLTPIHDAGHHVLRAIWIDKSTHLPLRYLAEMPVNYAGSGQVVAHEATIDTSLIDGNLTNARVDGRFRIAIGVTEMSGVVSWSVSQVSFPEAEPDWVFDMAQWKQHLNEPIPNLAPVE